MRECLPPTTCHMSHVMYYVSHIIFLFVYKVGKIIGGGSVINRAYFVWFINDAKFLYKPIMK